MRAEGIRLEQQFGSVLCVNDDVVESAPSNHLDGHHVFAVFDREEGEQSTKDSGSVEASFGVAELQFQLPEPPVVGLQLSVDLLALAHQGLLVFPALHHRLFVDHDATHLL